MDRDEKIFSLGSRPVYGLKIVLCKYFDEVIHEIIQSDQTHQLLKSPCCRDCSQFGRSRSPLIITQNGEAKVVLQDIESYEQTQEIIALLKILALGNRQIEAGKVEPATVVIQRLRERRKDRRCPIY